MALIVLGDADDVRGFRLAGVKATTCRTESDVDRALDDLPGLLTRGDEPAGVVLVSEAVRRLAPAAIDALATRTGWPIVVVMPEREVRTEKLEGKSED